MHPARLLLPVGLTLLTACAQHPAAVTLEQQGKCPLYLNGGQTLILSLPSNPSTGYRWQLLDAAAPTLRSLGPEVYSAEETGLVGSGGRSTWRFQAADAGEARLLLHYLRPWETGVAPAETFDCLIQVK
ncbi:MAG: protease inhibitor I42 family protein [Pseudomonadota bacterium]